MLLNPRYPVLDIIDGLFDVLSNDTTINSRTDSLNNTLTTKFYRYLSIEKLIKHLKLNENNEELRYFNTPLVAIYSRGKVNYPKDYNNVQEKTEGNWTIDCMFPDVDLQESYLRCFKLCDDIRQVLNPIQGLNRKASTARVQVIQDLDYIQYNESPFISMARCSIESYTR